MILRLLPLYLRNKAEVVPRVAPGPFVTDVQAYAMPPANGLRVTWFGHSASLIEIDGVRILIDPVWDERASPFTWAGPKRFFAPTAPLASLGHLDAVLFSHDHYDHLGAKTVRALAKLPHLAETTWVTSLGVCSILRRFGVPAARIVELDWTESARVEGRTPGSSLRVTAWPSRHFSGRSPLNRFETLWSSFVLEGPQHRVFYGADSGWWDGFAEIGAQYDGFDLTMLEIGAFHPLWWTIHLGPANALKAYEALRGGSRKGLLMPIHWGLFNLALHGWREPIAEMERLAAGNGTPLWSPTPGEPTDVAGPMVSAWWRENG